MTFIVSISLHEAAHAYAALKGGDPAACFGGQVSLDPSPHMRHSPVGMVVVPIIAILYTGYPIGFASTPYNPEWAKRHPKRAALMALAGPIANLGLTLLCGVCLFFGLKTGVFAKPETFTNIFFVTSFKGGIWPHVAHLLCMFFAMNLILFLFNSVPLPPLDGSQIIHLFFSKKQSLKLQSFSKNPLASVIGIFFMITFFKYLFKPVLLMSLRLIYDR